MKKKKTNFDETLFSQCVDIRYTHTRPLLQPLTAVDLFCGCGGLTLGMIQAGINVVAGIEFNENASYTYSRNFHHPVLTEDITLESTKEHLEDIVNKETNSNGVDIVFGGPPCQGFSMAGKRKITDPRNSLYKEYVEIVKRLKPKYCMVENVEGMLTLGNGFVLKLMVGELEKLGYDVSVRTLSATDYGTAQRRKRMILIANNVGIVNYHPLPIYNPWEYKTVRDAISDLEYMPENKEFSQIYTLHNKEKIMKIGEMKEGEHYSSTYNGTLRRLFYDRPSPTVTYSNGNPDIHPKCNRVLTLREMARLQGFPDSFMFYGNKQEQGKMISNAVPPQFGWAVGSAIIEMEHLRLLK